jgi:hypothetical protein
MRKYNYDTTRANASRCGHSYCTECRKRRGRNIGNRRIRRSIKTFLHMEKRAS